MRAILLLAAFAALGVGCKKEEAAPPVTAPPEQAQADPKAAPPVEGKGGLTPGGPGGPGVAAPPGISPITK